MGNVKEECLLRGTFSSTLFTPATDSWSVHVTPKNITRTLWRFLCSFSFREVAFFTEAEQERERGGVLVDAPKKFVAQGLSRKPSYRAICFKFNFFCHRSSIWFLLLYSNNFSILFISDITQRFVAACGLAARLFGILVFVANANSVFFP